MNISLLLNGLTLITGLVWIMDLLVLNPQRRKGMLVAINQKKNSKTTNEIKISNQSEPIYVEYSKALFPLLLIIFLFRNFTDSVDYGLVLVIATAVSGVIWLIDKIAFESKRKQSISQIQNKNLQLAEEEQAILYQDPLLVEYAKSFFPVILIILILRSFFFEPFKIPSGSMKPTLEIGDFVLVNKFSYGVKLPVNHQKIMSYGEPQRGDVFVFRYPGDPKIDYIKRVIGLPGDTIVYKDKDIYIKPACLAIKNDQACPALEKIPAKLLERDGYKDLNGSKLDLYEEDLLGVSHQILHDPTIDEYTLVSNFKQKCMNGYNEWTIPQNHYFAMGDNREHSADSRFWCFVPEENLVGRAVAIWMHFNWDEKYKLDFSRIGAIK